METSDNVLDSVAIRFAGDSGDGIQLTGTRFSQESARIGNDLVTLPDFPAEIRAPAGTLGGVSAFQIHFGSQEIFTAGDEPDVLVAMNPAALKGNIEDVKRGGVVICNSDTFTERNLQRVDYSSSPLQDEDLQQEFKLIPVQITSLTREALSEVELSKSAVEKCKNFFALGIVCWMYGRGVQETKKWIESKFAKRPKIAEANLLALEGGIAFAEASELFAARFEVPEAELEPGTYRNLTGNQGIAYGLIAASVQSELQLFYAGYPITPASDILHEISKHKNFGVATLQAEDEIASCCAAIGAAYGGALAVTTSSGPGILLKQEAIALAVMAELPLVVINVQRAGPSTGLPTKTEQADLLQSLFGRNGECPVAVLAVASPDDAFETTIEACRIAIEHMTPVVLLSDGYIGNGSRPWRVPSPSSLPKISPCFKLKQEGDFQPYRRDPNTLARAWALPGTAGQEHRIGGLEKQDITGNISYDPENHERMVQLRAERIQRIADTLPPLELDGPDKGDLLVIGWGGTFGSISGAVKKAQADGRAVSHLHLRHIHPFPKDLNRICNSFKQILVPELNSGQLRMLLQDRLLRQIEGLSKIQGQPFMIREVRSKIKEMLS